MTGVPTASNVYYLPLAATAALAQLKPVSMPRWQVMIGDALWRARFILAEIRHVLTSPVPRPAPFLADQAELVISSRPRGATPGRVIDFEAARLRRRPV